ncbi:hypothetical protein LguiA_018742 [Lonicera macranthoides]
MSSSSDSIFTSGFSEQRWVDQISKNFNKEYAIDISDVPVSIFNVPKAISDFKPEAYVPQVIALGPYHHFRPELYQMERYKVAAVQSFLNSHQNPDVQPLLIDKLKQLDPTIRACYHKYLDLDDNTLVWIIAIDGLFLLDLLRAYSDGFSGNKMTQNSVLCRDIVIQENQYPAILLKEIRKILQFVDVDENNYDYELYKMLRDFCIAHSPFPLRVKLEPPPNSFPLHLLDLMYHLILSAMPARIRSKKSASKSARVAPVDSFSNKAKEAVEIEMMKEDLILNVKDIMNIKSSLVIGGGGEAWRPVQPVQSVPWERIYNLLGLKSTPSKVDETNTPIVEEISIPSVTNLSKAAGIMFQPAGGIRDVEFNEKECTLYLPVITLNNNTEVLLRNLMVYEAAISNSALELTQYVDLMCGIIDTAEDAKMLIESGIIKGELTSEKTADLFNGMNKSGGNVRNRTKEKINAYFNKKPRVKVYRFWKKKVYDAWKALTVLSTILLLLMLILQSFCQVYGCARFFGRINY